MVYENQNINTTIDALQSIITRLDAQLNVLDTRVSRLERHVDAIEKIQKQNHTNVDSIHNTIKYMKMDIKLLQKSVYTQF